MRILKRKGLTKRQLDQLDNYWWASVDQTLRVFRDQGISPVGCETRASLYLMVEEFADAIDWLRELSKKGRYGNCR